MAIATARRIRTGTNGLGLRVLFRAAGAIALLSVLPEAAGAAGIPDLAFTSISVTDTTPIVGQEFDIELGVANNGTGDAESTTVRYYSSTDSTISTADTELNTSALAALAPAATADPSATVSLDTEGTFWVGACIDAVTDEVNTANNCTPGVQVVVDPAPTPPDLAVTDIGVSDSTVVTDEEFTISSKIENLGETTAEASTRRYFLSTDMTITTGDTEVASGAVLSLTPGAFEQVDHAESIDTAGTYWIGVCVDTVTDETVTNNNCSDCVQVEVSDPPMVPDLVATIDNVDGTSFAAGELFTVNSTVENQGSATAEASTRRFFASDDATITTGDDELLNVAQDSLLAGASENTNQPVSIDTPGSYWVGICVDTVTDETETANNCSAGIEVTINDEPLGPDLQVTEISVSNDDVDTDESFSITSRVANQGNQASAASTRRYYRSDDATITTADTEISTFAVGALNPGATENVMRAVSIDTAGSYWVGVCVDDVANELDTANNCSTGIPVTVTDVPLIPDLVGIGVTLSNLAPAPDQDFTVTSNIQNQGNTTAPASTRRFYLSTDATISSADTEIDSGALTSLAAGSTEMAMLTTSIDTAGDYWLGVCADAVAGETATANNCSLGTAIRVVAADVDSDGDGLTDEQELNVHGTDPDIADSDGDGESDGAEVTAGRDPLINEPVVLLDTLLELLD